MKADRRTFLVAGSAITLSTIALTSILHSTVRPLKFDALETPSGFRSLQGGRSSSGFDWLTGLEPGFQSKPGEGLALSEADLPKALFGPQTKPIASVQIASFSDFYCPFCRVSVQQLRDIEYNSNGRIQIRWHELPILGEASLLAAKAAIASGVQGQYDGMSKRLISTPFRVNNAYLKTVSNDLGLNFEQLLTDMESERVAKELMLSAELAKLFAIVGTPAMVVGRTVVYGAISKTTLKKLIEYERAPE